MQVSFPKLAFFVTDFSLWYEQANITDREIYDIIQCSILVICLWHIHKNILNIAQVFFKHSILCTFHRFLWNCSHFLISLAIFSNLAPLWVAYVGCFYSSIPLNLTNFPLHMNCTSLCSLSVIFIYMLYHRAV